VSTVRLDEKTNTQIYARQEKNKKKQLKLEFDKENIVSKGLSQSNRPN
jgi:hypothetical protein